MGHVRQQSYKIDYEDDLVGSEIFGARFPAKMVFSIIRKMITDLPARSRSPLSTLLSPKRPSLDLSQSSDFGLCALLEMFRRRLPVFFRDSLSMCPDIALAEVVPCVEEFPVIAQ